MLSGLARPSANIDRRLELDACLDRVAKQPTTIPTTTARKVPAAEQTAAFCRRVKEWMAFEKQEASKDNVDQEWVLGTTSRLNAMWGSAPSQVKNDVRMMAQSIIKARRDAVNLMGVSIAEFPTEYAGLLGDLDAGIASTEFRAATGRVNAYTKTNCGVDIEAELAALAAEALG